MVVVPYERIPEATLRRMIEEFVTRDGTDYGLTEVPLETRVENVMHQLRKGKTLVVYDEENESANLVTREQLQQAGITDID
jgi:uncharacterized protein YheU (UPF0270 family)